MEHKLVGVVLMMIFHKSVAYEPSPDGGYPAGLVPNCPGVLKNATLKSENLPLLQVVVHRLADGKPERTSLPIATAHKTIAKNKYLDYNKKTVVYISGFLDNTMFPHSMAMANAYARRGYNVLAIETFYFFTYIYPKSVRVAREIGKLVGDFLAKLADQGLDNNKLEMVGISLGAHSTAYVAKRFFAVTGKKPFRITGLDPAGPCFRAMPPEEKLNPSDAQRVDVLHTNIDGFGIAERLGHVDFYVNGGEYQPNDIPYIPCLVICSHFRSVIYHWIALDHPKKFIAMQCDSIQDARFARCYDSKVTNYIGLETNFNRTGIFYLGTHNEFPYFRGRDGLNRNNEIYSEVSKRINSDDIFDA
ncbi:lipase member H-like [Aricia agestis]|uniref:lipase member H-like n=1 Tax=Aricia agestis TaxID=91739 RepID=UPI001C20A851|nr:lipase member H-like [Aricia agestis]XP_041972742.1 lipase member H-like [Aricia agestis]XP_041972752.1 lipase member H-like [Aricia agestis]XP_041972761.1 lipase member H-like [Aricia agestis]XP_041972769.1 lipase member H-like [Aricia agestis]